MLTRIRLVNIQKHKNLTLNLDKINVITGATDTGKTSVFRGLLWGLTNNEAGDNLINNEGAKSCSVLINVDGHEVERSWTKSKNAYRLDSKEFTTFRTTVPTPIADILNMTDLNVQGRRDLPFMVYYKASECANQFSEMLDLEEIDSTISNVNKAVKQKTELVDTLKQQVKQYEDALKQYDKVDDAVKALAELGLLRGKLLQVEDRLNALLSLRKQVSDAQEAFDRTVNPYHAITTLRCLESLQKQYEEVVDRYEDLAEIKESADHYAETLRRVCSADKADREFKKVTDIVAKGKDIRTQIDALTELKQQYDRCIGFVDCTKQNYDRLHTEFVETFPDVCPLCGGTNHAL